MRNLDFCWLRFCMSLLNSTFAVLSNVVDSFHAVYYQCSIADGIPDLSE